MKTGFPCQASPAKSSIRERTAGSRAGCWYGASTARQTATGAMKLALLVLAVPGVPVVASPKSALIIRVTLWDDAAGKKLNETPEQITIVESFSADTWIGSGLTQPREKQMENLTRNAAKLIQNWMVRQKATQGWFGPDAEAETNEE